MNNSQPKPKFLLLCAILLFIVLFDSTSAWSFSWGSKDSKSHESHHAHHTTKKPKTSKPIGWHITEVTPKPKYIHTVSNTHRPTTKKPKVSQAIGWQVPSHVTSKPKPSYNISTHWTASNKTKTPIGWHVPAHTTSKPNYSVWNSTRTSKPNSSSWNRVNQTVSKPKVVYEESEWYDEPTTKKPKNSFNFNWNWVRTTTKRPRTRYIVVEATTPRTKRPSNDNKNRTTYFYKPRDPYYKENLAEIVTTRNGSIEELVLPHGTRLVPQDEVKAPITNCGMSLCTDVINYPLDEINDVIELARLFMTDDLISNGLKKKGLSNDSLTSSFDSFWFGKEAPEHHFVDNKTNCAERVSTYYPLEGSRANKNYYIVNVPSLKQGLTKIECESSYQMCSANDDNIKTSNTRECRQMYRLEKLLVLPYEKNSKSERYSVADLELQKFHVPTGCACIESK